MHVVSACAGYREGSDHFGSLGLMYATFPYIFARDLMVTRQQLYRCARAPLHL
jgi:hypothetical protein